MSTIPAVLAALVSLAEATLPSDEWQILNGTRSSVTVAEHRMAAIGDGDIVGTDPAAPAVTAEDYVVPISFIVSSPGSDQTVPDADAIDAYEAVIAALPTFAGGNLGLEAQGVLLVFATGEFTMERRADQNGRHTRHGSGIRVIAQTV